MEMIRLGIADLAPGKSNPTPHPMRSFPLPAFAEAQRWCSLPEPRKRNLRSPELDPSNTLKIRDQDDIHKWVQEKYEAYRGAVEELITRRSDLIQRVVTNSGIASSDLKGKLLLYQPLETVSDGAAEASSKGFFDVKDAPPWDTWLAYFEGAIVSWVPEDLIFRAQAGIDANPVDCIHWLDT